MKRTAHPFIFFGVNYVQCSSGKPNGTAQDHGAGTDSAGKISSVLVCVFYVHPFARQLTYLNTVT